MGLVADIFASFRRPRAVFRARLAAGMSNYQAFGLLMAASAMMFVAQTPRLAREALIDPTIPLEARLGATFIGFFAIVPLMAYILSPLVDLLLHLMRRPHHLFTTRASLFWAMVMAAPFWLINGAVIGFMGQGIPAAASSVLALGVFGFFFVLCLSVSAQYLLETQKDQTA